MCVQYALSIRRSRIVYLRPQFSDVDLFVAVLVLIIRTYTIASRVVTNRSRYEVGVHCPTVLRIDSRVR